MIYPNKEKYIEDSRKHNLIPVFEEIRTDFETPVSIFLKVKGKILLESIEKGENVGRFSFIGLGKRVLLRMEGRHLTIIEYNNGEIGKTTDFNLKNPLEKVREYFNGFSVPNYEKLPGFFGGAIGYLGYETVQYFEDIPIKSSSNDQQIPDGVMVVPEILLVYDSVKRSVIVTTLTFPDSKPQKQYQEAVIRIEQIARLLAQPLSLDAQEPKQIPPELEIENQMEKEEFLEAVKICKENIENGEIIQAVISQKFHIHTQAPPFDLYRTLRILNPSPYLYFLDLDDFCIIGSSPEVMVRLYDGEILLKPIAGTRERGQTVDDDHAISEELLQDPKERAEHLMLVDLGRNDLGRVARPGSVQVTDYMKVEKYSHVMHLVSTIKAELDKEYDVFDVIQACFPAGTLTGAPKIRAMQIIEKLEPEKRGPYGGMVFNLGFNGNMDSCITIRTIILKDKCAILQAGAGIVADSVAEKEYQETLNKARSLVETIQLTNEEINQ